MERVTNMKTYVGKRFEAVLAMALLCAFLLSGKASAASLVALDLAEIVEQTAPSVVEVFTETKQVSSWFQEYVTEGAGSGMKGLAFAIPFNAAEEIAGELMESGKQAAVNVTLTEKGPE